MQQFFQFLVHHWILVSLLLLVFIALIVEEQKNQRSPTNLSPQAATQLINREQALIIDLREAEAFNGGHIVNAMHLPAIMENQQKIKKYREKPIIVVDNAGQNAVLIAQKLRKANFTRVYSLSGGIQAWKNDGLPLTTKT